MENENVVFDKNLIDNFESINKGIRPEGMSYEAFKYYRKVLNKLLKKRLQGTLVHLSSTYGTIKGNGKTYIKPKEIVTE